MVFLWLSYGLPIVKSVAQRRYRSIGMHSARSQIPSEGDVIFRLSDRPRGLGTFEKVSVPIENVDVLYGKLPEGKL